MNRFQRYFTSLLSIFMFFGAGGAQADTSSKGNKIGEWRVAGFDRENSANSSPTSRISQANMNDLKIKWIYNIDPIALTGPIIPGRCSAYPGLQAPPVGVLANPCDDARPGHGVAGVALDRNGRIYANTYDGRILYIHSKKLASGTNPDGTAKPVLLKQLDLFTDPAFGSSADIDSGKMVYVSRMHPTVIGDGLFAGNEGFWPSITPGNLDPSWIFTDDLVNNWDWAKIVFGKKAYHTPTTTYPDYKSAGSVLYKIDRRTGALLWKTTVDEGVNGSIPMTGGTPIYNQPGGDLIVVPFGASNISGTLGTFDIVQSGSPYGDPYGGHCCDSRGGVAAVRVSDGAVIWKTYFYPKQIYPTVPTVSSSAQLDDAVARGQNPAWPGATNGLPPPNNVLTGSINAWTGGSMWGGGHAPFSKKLNLIYVGTDEGFSAPNEASRCEQERIYNPGGPGNSDPNKCLHYVQDPNNPSNYVYNTTATFNDNVVEASGVNSPRLPLFDALVAMDATTGKIKWSRPVGGFDVWNLSCFGLFGFPAPYSSPANLSAMCPAYLKDFNLAGLNFVNKDADFAATPVLIENVKLANGTTRDIVIGAGKAGAIRAFDAATGADIWPAVSFVNFSQIASGSFMYGMTTDGIRIYGATGSQQAGTSGASTLTKAMRDAPGNPYHVVQDGSCIDSGFGDNGAWAGGLYVAINLNDGSIAWQRCAIGQVGANNRPVKTLTPIADCINHAAIDPGDTCAAGNTTAGLTFSNDLLIAGGTSNYQDNYGMVSGQPYGEAILLDPATGALLKELPMGVLGQPMGNSIVYNRAIAVGKTLILSNGNHLFLNTDPTENGYRIVMYHLSSDTDEEADDKNENDVTKVDRE